MSLSIPNSSSSFGVVIVDNGHDRVLHGELSFVQQWSSKNEGKYCRKRRALAGMRSSKSSATLLGHQAVQAWPRKARPQGRGAGETSRSKGTRCSAADKLTHYAAHGTWRAVAVNGPREWSFFGGAHGGHAHTGEEQ